MPLLLTVHPFPNATFGLWQIAENEEFFRVDMPLSADEASDLAQHHVPLRRLEWLASRWLLHKLTDAPQRLPIAKDAFSKPFFPENQDLACSLSHSRGCVGALIVTIPGIHNGEASNIGAETPSPHLGRLGGAGCDIQVMTDKMNRIAYKFLNEEEYEFLDTRPEAENLELLHLYWTAKESLYKAYGLKGLDFRKNIFVQNIQWNGEDGEALGKVEKEGFCQEFQLIFGKYTIPEAPELIWAVCHAD